MVEYNQKRKVVEKNIKDVYLTIKNNLEGEWQLLFENRTPKQGELLYLVGMFSGAKLPALWMHGARRGLLFIKLFKKDEKTTNLLVITGGTEDLFGFDFGRHKNNLRRLFKIFDKNVVKPKEKVNLSVDETFDRATEAYTNGKLSTALALYNKVLEADNENIEALHSKGLTLAILGDRKEALKCFKKALELNPGDQELNSIISELEKV